MANQTIPNLPAAVALSGAELLEGVQAGRSVRMTAAQVAALSRLTNGLNGWTPVLQFASVGDPDDGNYVLSVPNWITSGTGTPLGPKPYSVTVYVSSTQGYVTDINQATVIPTEGMAEFVAAAAAYAATAGDAATTAQNEADNAMQVQGLQFVMSVTTDGFVTIDQYGGTGSNFSQSDGTSEWPGFRSTYNQDTQTSTIWQSDDPLIPMLTRTAGSGWFSAKTISSYDIRNKAMLAERLAIPFEVAQCILGMVNLVLTSGQSFSVGEVGHPTVPSEATPFFSTPGYISANLWSFGYSANSATPTGSPEVWNPQGFEGSTGSMTPQALANHTSTIAVPLYALNQTNDDALPGKNTGTGQSAAANQNTGWVTSFAYMHEFCRYTLGDIPTGSLAPWNAPPIRVFMSCGKSATAIEQHGKGGPGPGGSDANVYFNKLLSAATKCDIQSAISWPGQAVNIECLYWSQGQNNLNGSPDAYGIGNDYNSNASGYQNAFVAYKRDFYNTVVRRAGSTQTSVPMIYVDLPGGSYVRDRPDEQVFDALRHVADASADTVVVQPNYPFMNLNHPDFNSYRTMGLKGGYVRWRVLTGKGWVPLQSIDHIILQDEILCNYFTEYPLQFQPVYDNDVYTQTSFADWGFEVRDLSNNVLPIKAVSLPAAALNGTCVLIKLVSVPSGPVNVFYAADKFVHNGAGNLCNTRPPLIADSNSWGCYYYAVKFSINPAVGAQPSPYQNGKALIFWDWALNESLRPALPYAGDV